MFLTQWVKVYGKSGIGGKKEDNYGRQKQGYNWRLMNARAGSRG